MLRKTVFAGNSNSQYDPSLIAKEVHDFYGQSIRVLNSREVAYYTHFKAIYNNSNKPTSVEYFRGTLAYKTNITFTSATAGYFIIHSAPANQMYVIWYNVDGAGSAPVVSGAIYIEVAVSSSDPSVVVAAATASTLNNLYAELFIASRNGSSVEIFTNGMGVIDPSFDISTGFTITGTQGAQESVSQISIPYIVNDPVFQGQVLKGYSYDLYSGTFVKNPELAMSDVTITDQNGDKLQINTDGSLNVNVISSGQRLKSYFFQLANVVTGMTEDLCSYTPTVTVYLQKIEFSGTNIASFELYIDGVLQDKKLTFFNGNLENIFNFNAGLNVAAGKNITVKVYHNRPDPGDFTARIQILESGA